MSNFDILPVFPSVIAATKIDHNLDTFWQKIKNEEFVKTTADDTEGVYATRDMEILEKHQELKKVITEKFYNFKNDTLKVDNTNFKITTSWVTKTEPNGFCQYHNHRNSYYSGILYCSPTNDVSSGNLLFSDSDHGLMINEPSEWNIFNSNVITIEPDTNLLIFFPSKLRHRITKYTGDENRYSLAFNFFPIGTFGNGDSTVNLNLL